MNDSLPVANAIKLTSLRNYKLIQIHVDIATNVEKHECFCAHIRLYFYEFSSKCFGKLLYFKETTCVQGVLVDTGIYKCRMYLQKKGFLASATV